MGEIIGVHNGMRYYDFKAYFTDDGTYVERFTTSDGTRWMGRAKPSEYPPDVREEAIRLGVIDKKGNVIPVMKPRLIK